MDRLRVKRDLNNLVRHLVINYKNFNKVCQDRLGLIIGLEYVMEILKRQKSNFLKGNKHLRWIDLWGLLA